MNRRGFVRRSGALLAALGALDLELAADVLSAVDPRLRSLQRVVHGPVLTPASAAYDTARLEFNTRFDGVHPLAVVQPLGPGDVSRTILWARKAGVRLAARSGGHSYGGYSTTSGGVVDLGRLNGISVDVRGRTATIGAGARLGDVVSALAAKGVAIPAGSCPTVGVGGLALGGGVGLASRAWGTASDNVLALRVVTADGRVRTCSPQENPDLYWACRGGGGGNFGIATSFTFRVHPVSNVSWFIADWPWQQVEEVVRAWQAFGPHAPDGLFSLCALGTSLGSTPHVEVFGQFLGPEATLGALLAPLRRVAGIKLTTGTSPYLFAQLRWAGCLHKTPAACRIPPRSAFAAKSDYFDRQLTAAGAATLRRWLERAQAARFGSASILLDSYGGALNRVPPDATAFVHRNELCSAQYLVYWSRDASPALGWLRAAHAAMAPHVSGSAYQNYIDPELATWRQAYYGANLARLVQVKHQVDPDRFFRFAQAV